MSAVLERDYICSRQLDALLIVELTDEGFQVLWNIAFLEHAAKCAECARVIEEVLEQIRPSLDKTRNLVTEPREGRQIC
jgi:hypothetical protein